MHLFTILQVLGLAVLWVVKSTQLALAFPFFVVAMIPYRMSLKYLFSPRELDAVRDLINILKSFDLVDSKAIFCVLVGRSQGWSSDVGG